VPELSPVGREPNIHCVRREMQRKEEKQGRAFKGKKEVWMTRGRGKGKNLARTEEGAIPNKK